MLGIGTKASPYIIQTPTDLNNVRNKVTSTTYYELGNDIDMSGWGNFALIGESTSTKRFKGFFDGKGFAIKNITVSSTVQYSGLFGYVDGGTIENLAVIDANVSSTTGRVGIIVGLLYGATSVIRNCFSSGSVKGLNYVGGIAGVVSGTVENCYSIANVHSSTDASGVARIDSPVASTVRNSYFNGTLSSASSTSLLSGVSGGTPSSVKLVNSYFNSDKAGSNVIDDSNGIHLTDAQMKEKSSFADFNESIWTFEEGKYPYLTLTGEFEIPNAPIPVKKETISVTSHSKLVLSSLKSSKRKLQTTITFTLPLASNVHRELVVSSMSIVEAITSSALIKKNVNSKTYTVTSSISELAANSTRVTKAIRSIGSHIDLIGSEVTVTVPQEIEKPIYATVHFIVNPSMTSIKHSESITNYLTQKSNTTIITNKSNTSIKENATEMQVV